MTSQRATSRNVQRRHRSYRAAAVMTPDSVLVESRPVFLLVEVVRLGEVGQQPGTVARQGAAGEGLLDCGCEMPGRVPGCLAQELLAVATEVSAEKREQLKHRVVGQFAGDIWPLAAPGAAVTDWWAQQRTVAFPEPLFVLDFLRGPSGTRHSSGFPLFIETPLSPRAEGDETFSQL
jgi:hypothetical protein